jgi:hypothetical protein
VPLEVDGQVEPDEPARFSVEVALAAPEIGAHPGTRTAE